MASLLILGIGTVIVALGVLVIRFREPVAQFFRGRARRLYGDKIVERVYTGGNMGWGGGAWIGFGCLLLLIGILGLTGVLHLTFG